ncbi:competence type IV pilus minor pilin ComGE [Listeria grandensis]|uniref:competence type IV pilus minor pilin ComGE n=1 Tax=Listeria grandensis TaxID=1494963 RepID=UPI00164E01AE|nr:competence type IV pilus minor pilin ComGE [Listeria grandensis]MBC6314616.1 hypothetical protein [Listeria grandensis]
MNYNGFSLLESLFSLSLLSLIILSLLPMMMQIKENLHHQNQRTTAYQLLAEESTFHISNSLSSNYTVIIKNQSYQITYNQEVKQLCATYAKENICYATK